MCGKRPRSEAQLKREAIGIDYQKPKTQEFTITNKIERANASHPTQKRKRYQAVDTKKHR